MDVLNCRKCGRLFNYIHGDKICPGCKDKLEDVFQKVKAFVTEHRYCTMNDICEACEVDQRQIQKWIREERLEFADDSPIKLPCESCGTRINSGKYCQSCKNKLQNNLNKMYTKSAAELRKEPVHRAEKDSMRYFRR